MCDILSKVNRSSFQVILILILEERKASPITNEKVKQIKPFVVDVFGQLKCTNQNDRHTCSKDECRLRTEWLNLLRVKVGDHYLWILLWRKREYIFYILTLANISITHIVFKRESGIHIINTNGLHIINKNDIHLINKNGIYIL